jgi:hypothetical protein
MGLFLLAIQLCSRGSHPLPLTVRSQYLVLVALLIGAFDRSPDRLMYAHCPRLPAGCIRTFIRAVYIASDYTHSLACVVILSWHHGYGLALGPDINLL